MLGDVAVNLLMNERSINPKRLILIRSTRDELCQNRRFAACAPCPPDGTPVLSMPMSRTDNRSTDPSGRRLRLRIHAPATTILNGRAMPRNCSSHIPYVNNTDLTLLPFTLLPFCDRPTGGQCLAAMADRRSGGSARAVAQARVADLLHRGLSGAKPLLTVWRDSRFKDVTPIQCFDRSFHS